MTNRSSYLLLLIPVLSLSPFILLTHFTFGVPSHSSILTGLGIKTGPSTQVLILVQTESLVTKLDHSLVAITAN